MAAVGATLTVGNLPSVLISKARLTDIFTELLKNAVEYRHPDRPLAIAVSAECNADSAIFSVMDNGIGIAPEYRQRVFTVFERLHHNDEYPGTGIGLSLVQKIVESVGGHVWIADGLDGGICVSFSLNRE